MPKKEVTQCQTTVLIVWCLLVISNSQGYAGEVTEIFKNSQLSVGVSTWLSTGESHESLRATPEGIDAFALESGQKVSDLRFEDQDSNIIQLDAELNLPSKFFLRGNYGWGAINDGKLTDRDFINEVEFSKTVNPADNDRLWFVNIDLGREVYKSSDEKFKFRGFLGYQHWLERLVARSPFNESILFGLDRTTTDNNLVAPNQNLITLDYSYNSLRLGLDAGYQFTDRFRLDGNIVYIPYTGFSNTDTHHLRDDLANPSVKSDGSGNGYNFDISARFLIVKNLSFNAGYRYWYLSLDEADTTFFMADGTNSSNTRKVDFETERHGVTLGLTYSF